MTMTTKRVHAIIRANTENDLIRIADDKATKILVAGRRTQYNEKGKLITTFRYALSPVTDEENHGLWLIGYTPSTLVYARIPIRAITLEETQQVNTVAQEHPEDPDAYAFAMDLNFKTRVEDAVKSLQWLADTPLVDYAQFVA